MSYRDWHFGMKLVCIDDQFGWAMTADRRYCVPIRVPMLHEILTIRELKPAGDKLFVAFAEIETIQKHGPLVAEIMWGAECFRPLVTKTTDIAVFSSMLSDTKQKVPA
ncbi:hypothetical protein [Mesorhizobium sp. M0203]|uniref:hypothetical protein n=1 Tax=Mesorhizobium sp. M0203 TaxID=2956912 RepID=UPI00333C79BE